MDCLTRIKNAILDRLYGRAVVLKPTCDYCAHWELALRRQPSYHCPRCKTLYEREDKGRCKK
jgi:tRNA(Ile2) C34 agmatinyltransferase TiaS